MNNTVNISNLSKETLLKKLWFGSKNAAVFSNTISLPFDSVKASTAVQKRIDYFCGRVIKMDISQDSCDSFLYNRDNGDGAVEKIVASMRSN